MEEDPTEAVLVKLEPSEHQLETVYCACLRKLKPHIFFLLTIAGVVVGFVVGFSVRPAHPTEDGIMWIGILGDVYMRMMTMLIVPMLVCMVISATGSLDPRSNGRISIIALSFAVISNAVGTLLGIIVYKIFNPAGGTFGSSSNDIGADTKQIRTQDIFSDFIRNIFPSNVVKACFEQVLTTYVESPGFNDTGNITTKYVRHVGSTSGTNVMGLIVVCTIFGMTASSAGEAGRPFLSFFKSASDIIVILMQRVIWFTPIGVASLIASSVAGVADIENTFRLLGMLVLAVTVGVASFELVIIPLGYFIVTRSNPGIFLYSMIRPVLAAFGPPSSGMAIPEMINTLENKLRIDPRVARSGLAVMYAFSASGSCIFISAGLLFVAALAGRHFDVTQLALLWILITMVALALPGVPSASIVIIIIILTSMDISAEHVGLLLAMEWYLDRIRTTGNTMAMTFGTVLIYRLCRSRLEKQDREQGVGYDSNQKEFQIDADEDNGLNSVVSHKL